MKPRTSVYRILSRCKAAKHGTSEKAKRNQENAKVAQEVARLHERACEETQTTWELMDYDY